MLKIGEFSKLAQVSPKALRLYDERGLLRPAWIDRFTGYRYYHVRQLAALNRILAYKDLGFSLEQIEALQRDDLPAAELRGMMRLKQAELARHIQGEQARLARIEARLGQIEREEREPVFEVVLKSVPALRVAAIRDRVRALDDVLDVLDELQASLQARGVMPQVTAPPLAIFHDAAFRERGLDVEVALPLPGDLGAGGRVQLGTLPTVETMACLLHHGPYGSAREAQENLIHWIDSSGYQIDGPNRDLFLQREPESLTEVQFPIKPRPYLSTVLSFKEQKRMEIKIVSKPAFSVGGLPYFGKNEAGEIPQMWDQLWPQAAEIKEKVEAEICYGVCGEMDEDGRFHYLAGFQVEPGSEMPQGMEKWEVPEQTYAVFPSTLQTIHETYQYAFQTWLPESEYEHVPGPDFEFYDSDFDPAKGTGLFIYVPVQKK